MRKVTFFVMVLILGSVTNSALADTISYSYSSYAVSVPSGGYSDTWQFPQFDPGLGTLNQIRFIWEAWISGLIHIEGWGNGTIRPDFGEFGALSGYGWWHFDQGFGTHTWSTLDIPGSYNINLDNFPVSSISTGVPAPIYSNFIGKNSVYLTLEANAPSWGYYATGPIILNLAGWYLNGGVNVTAVYDYTPSAVPEPSSLLLLGTGLSGMAIAAWRRRK